jgi:phosphoribosylformimino-5-aminoimidazole carboxamide ribotide isomerase
MILYPAIDLKGGQCVRLLRGDMDKATVFSGDPAAQARAFVEAGAKWLHIVDLDGAVAGASANQEAIRQIRDAVVIPIQAGGGIRSIEAIELRLEMGIDRVILGTVAWRHPDLVKEACSRFPGAIVVSIDARDAKVAVEGWTRQSNMDATELALKFEDSGVAAIIYTDIDRDGTMQGVNVDATVRMANAIDIPVIASGGIASLDEIRALKKNRKIDGAILGRALYEGRFNLRDALQAAA